MKVYVIFKKERIIKNSEKIHTVALTKFNALNVANDLKSQMAGNGKRRYDVWIEEVDTYENS